MYLKFVELFLAHDNVDNGICSSFDAIVKDGNIFSYSPSLDIIITLFRHFPIVLGLCTFSILVDHLRFATKLFVLSPSIWSISGLLFGFGKKASATILWTYFSFDVFLCPLLNLTNKYWLFFTLGFSIFSAQVMVQKPRETKCGRTLILP